MSEERIEKIKERERKKERIRQANTAAAAFYTKCLVTLPTAGKARSHLRSRNISPQSIRAFALGYAPDCYYGDEADKRKRKWGEGSLVEYLADVGFVPDEIVEAGLAVRTRKKQLNNKNDTTERKRDGKDLSNKGGNETNTSDEDDADVEHDYSDLMDRFRSRLIIPIMDETGRNVIALGGRHLEPTASNDTKDNDEFSRPAKYINSPDSLVFTKKNVLFNRHGARLALSETISSRDDNVDSSDPATFDAPPAPSVIIVEGYFDAIALANVGISNAVASMGTALPLEQLNIAVQLLGVPGRIILCMDGDDAGTNAVERLCSGGNVLSKVPELNRNELYVATLPSDVGVKDPSDYVDFAGGGSNAGERFKEEVIDNAVPWDEWYVARILSRHQDDVVNAAKDGNSNESFSDLCDEISTFLATFPNPADRTRRAHKVAETLAGLIVAQDDLAGSSLSMLRVQLESDILNMSSRKAGVREAMERRIESTEGISGEAVASKMERLTAGGGLEGDDDDDDGKMTKNTLLSRANRPRNGMDKMIRASRPPPRSVATQNDRARSARRSFRPRQPPEERHLVPHFNGFTFKHQSDRDWLGLPRNQKKKPKMHLGETPSPVDERDRLRAETPMFESNKNIFARRKKEDAVYFNSNQYLGQQYLSPDAVRIDCGLYE
jgi:DNA primase catalytic core